MSQSVEYYCQFLGQFNFSQISTAKSEADLKNIKEKIDAIIETINLNGNKRQKNLTQIKSTEINLAYNKRIEQLRSAKNLLPAKTLFSVIGVGFNRISVSCPYNDKVTCKAFADHVRKQLVLPDDTLIYGGLSYFDAPSNRDNPITEYLLDYGNVYVNPVLHPLSVANFDKLQIEKERAI